MKHSLILLALASVPVAPPGDNKRIRRAQRAGHDTGKGR